MSKLVLLRGGGMPINEFMLVRLLKADAKQPTVDTGSWNGAFEPILGSWYLEEISPAVAPQFETLPLGCYRTTFHNGIDIPIIHTRGECETVIHVPKN